MCRQQAELPLSVQLVIIAPGVTQYTPSATADATQVSVGHSEAIERAIMSQGKSNGWMYLSVPVDNGPGRAIDAADGNRVRYGNLPGQIYSPFVTSTVSPLTATFTPAWMVCLAVSQEVPALASLPFVLT